MWKWLKDAIINNPNKVLGTIILLIILNPISNYITKRLTAEKPEVIIRQYYNTVEPEVSVPSKVGGLAIDYKNEDVIAKALYVVEISNEGNAPEEDLRFQLNFPQTVKLKFAKEPNLKIYNPKKITLDDDQFFAILGSFPAEAIANISFMSPQDGRLLCDVQIGIAGKKRVGQVEEIRGVVCE